MTVKVPFKSLKFGPHQAKVKHLSKKDAQSNWGLYFPHNFEMHLQASYPTKQKAAETALHECLHVILEERGVNLGKMEEETVTQLARGLFAFFRDNPQFAKWLCQCAS